MFIKQPKGKKMIPKHFEIRFEPTTLCNYKCIYCGNKALKRKKETMSLELFKRLLDKIMNETDQYKSITFVGIGEPLLDSGLEEKVAYSRNKYFDKFIPVTTNGSLLTVDRLDSLGRAGVDLIRVSLQGITPEGYEKTSGRNKKTYTTVLRNIFNASERIQEKKYNIELVVSVVLVGSEEINLVDVCKNTFKDACSFLEIWTPHNTGDCFSFRKIKKQRKNTCGMLFNGPLNVYVDGRIGLCCMEVHGKHILGDLKTQSLEEIYSSVLFKKIAAYHKNGKFKGSNLVCENCDQRNLDKSEALVYNSKFSNYKERIDKGSPAFFQNKK